MRVSGAAASAHFHLDERCGLVLVKNNRLKLSDIYAFDEGDSQSPLLMGGYWQPGNLGDMTVETLEQKLRGDDDTWKDCITQDPSAAVLMFYLNSGMFRFDEFKDFFDKSPSPDEAPALRTSISGWAT